MAGKSLDAKITESIVADWRTKAYSQQQLSDKWKVSKGAVNKLCKNVEQDCDHIVTAGIKYESGLAGHSDRIVTAIKEVVQDQTYWIARRSTISQIALNRIENELQSCDPNLIKPLVEAADKTYVSVELAPRFSTASVNISNTNAQQNNLESIMTEIHGKR